MDANWAPVAFPLNSTLFDMMAAASSSSIRRDALQQPLAIDMCAFGQPPLCVLLPWLLLGTIEKIQASKSAFTLANGQPRIIPNLNASIQTKYIQININIQIQVYPNTNLDIRIISIMNSRVVAQFHGISELLCIFSDLASWFWSSVIAFAHWASTSKRIFNLQMSNKIAKNR